MEVNNLFPWKKIFFDDYWEPIIILNSKYEIYNVNSKLMEISGYAKEELIGESPNKILDHIFAESISEDIFERKVFTCRLVSKVGLKIPIQIAFQSFKTAESSNDNYYFFTFIKDVTHETHLLRQLNATKEFALRTNQISSLVIRQSNLGPEMWYKDKLNFLHERFTNQAEIDDEILKISLVLTTALGQGGAYTTGLSEIPVYDYDIIAICFTKIVKDSSASDNHLKNKTYMIVAIFIPKSLSSLIDKRDNIEAIFVEQFENIFDIKEINKEFMTKLKKLVLFYDENNNLLDYLL